MIPWLLGMSLSRNRADETDDNRYLDNTDTNSPPPEEMFLQSLDHPHFPSLERYLGADDYFDYIKDDDPYDTRKMRQHSKQCYHPDHDTERPAHSTDCRPASLDVSSRIQGFPIGGCLCTIHRKNQQKIDRHRPSMDDITIGTQSSNFIIDDTRTHVNRILEQANISPINS
ncbi:unnamed protein product [Didymodactylos carnosus]|uniref:Uncharacterized protein n=1 Tax=Didymodactylos carnosus TaxID=1234261 RepID=A0A816DMD4_9BILA|nr:unnamed protein product [Didymodactylos carnosus]CAF4538837.1 unnamed protein product [Didymodactylos carnosus]